MVDSSWPSDEELDMVRKKVVKMSGSDIKDVRVVVSPYRICPLGAHIDHQYHMCKGSTSIFQYLDREKGLRKNHNLIFPYK